MAVHSLKCWSVHFDDILAGRKKSEVRHCRDREYAVGDRLELREWSERDGYTGRKALMSVTHVTRFAGPLELRGVVPEDKGVNLPVVVLSIEHWR